eukprot:Hpha_TRINITY_DN15217_c0_g4::TRINITY_DN15217_c0_g4_i1::g.66345::m.66345
MSRLPPLSSQHPSAGQLFQLLSETPFQHALAAHVGSLTGFEIAPPTTGILMPVQGDHVGGTLGETLGETLGAVGETLGERVGAVGGTVGASVAAGVQRTHQINIVLTPPLFFCLLTSAYSHHQ